MLQMKYESNKNVVQENDINVEVQEHLTKNTCYKTIKFIIDDINWFLYNSVVNNDN